MWKPSNRLCECGHKMLVWDSPQDNWLCLHCYKKIVSFESNLNLAGWGFKYGTIMEVK